MDNWPQPFGAKINIDAVVIDDDALDQQPGDAGLLGRKQSFPEFAEPGERGDYLVVVDVRPGLARSRNGLGNNGGCGQHPAQFLHHHGFYHPGVEPAGQGAILAAAIVKRVHRDVISVEPLALAGVGRRHGNAIVGEQQPLQDGRGLRA